jgi:hypothetical protein
MAVSEETYPGTRVRLPADVRRPFEVFVNGIAQAEGSDYEVRAGILHFRDRLASEGRLGARRWTSMLLGIAGSYGKDDSVDVVYTSGGCRKVAAKLPFELAASA